MLPSDAAVSLNLAEQTRKVLATLTPREEKVLAYAVRDRGKGGPYA
jgi:DNA-directed RNA polymerase sigma subunit (sigma70/sigma32)